MRESLLALSRAAGVASPPSAESYGGAYRFEIQNDVVRFGAGCERASASAFVTVLCDGSSEWTEPAVLRFLLGKSGSGWSITEIAEMESGAPGR